MVKQEAETYSRGRSGRPTGLTREQELLLAYLVRFASNLEGAQLGVFTGLIGELAACQALHAEWKPSRGFDALDMNRNRLSIKSRRFHNRKSSQRMSLF